MIEQISYKEAIDFLLPKHYSGRKPQIKWAFGWRDDGLQAVCTFGKPASRTLCTGVCGEEHSGSVWELNRLCRTENGFKGQLSEFVSGCLRLLKPHNIIVVSYSDTAMHHAGYIYQACNFMYTGATAKRTDQYVPRGKHHRHFDGKELNKRLVRSSKHRYVYFCADKRQSKVYRKALKYSIQPYPKTQNKTYNLGEYIKPIIIDKSDDH